MTTRLHHAVADPYTAERIRQTLDADLVEPATTLSLPKPKALENLKRWKIAAAASRSQTYAEKMRLPAPES